MASMGLIFTSLAAVGPFVPEWGQMRPFVGELVLMGTIVGVLLSAFWGRRSNAVAGVVSLAGLMLAVVGLLLVRPTEGGEQFRGMLVSDHFAVLWKILLLVFTAGVVLMWFSTTRVSMHEGDGPEFFTLLLGACLGMCLMGSTSNLLMIFMAVEMASLPSYVLAGFRKTDRVGSEAALKYVLFGAATSAVMVYGLSMLYGLYGTLQIGELARRVDLGGGVPLAVAMVGILAGVGFKISAVPFHFWCPDVFEGAGVDVAAFLSVASKGAGLTLLLRILMTIGHGLGYAGSEVLTSLAVTVGVMGAITCTVGNTGAYVQMNMKRLLAYSSIAHAGYMLCILSLVVRGGSDANGVMANSAAQALLLYLAVYLFMNLGAFTVAGLVQRETGGERLEDYTGLGRRSPLLAVCMGAFMFSLVGLPPFAGFGAKVYVMWKLGANGSWWWALVAVIGVNTVFSLYYYLRVVRVMFMVESEKPEMVVSPLGGGLALVCAVMLLVMLVAFEPVLNLTGRYAKLHLPRSVPTGQVVAGGL
ncbi:MAG: NADH-quinone oxidoreductase subunit N [Planctomycetota bacterium]|nr:NADH-quinone oxidoreductase subunit N [Planctomycetota bacterium]